MAEFNEDAQHPATAIRLQQAIREGDAPKSYELVAAIQVTTGVAILYFLISGLATAVSEFTINSWQTNGINADAVIGKLSDKADRLLLQLSWALFPILAAVLICAILSHVVQAGTAFGFKKPVWQPQQINPVSGMKRLFSLDNLLRGVIGVPKVAIIVLVTLVVIWNQRFEIAGLQQRPVHSLGCGLMNQIFIVLMSASGTLLAVSMFDYLVQWFSFQARTKMTDQQLRDENRLQSPDPQLKSRRIEFFDEISSAK